ncbi:hypothetical protein AJ78_05961 [Emergomyces pasteurianus Ep9510]|uniref:N-acetyltransferase domain-containing protein n=1 Tax=Emergomyces pasteurianus Ep9510 TaxID=1447872 RepID=A0A1J9PAP4_9EURO|nr:hypothetical protein AJ78_05961 [Emergomyces pasteurianus Ep9510]
MPTASSARPCAGATRAELRSHPFTIRPARTPQDLDAAISLIKTYTAGLGIDLSYQDFDSEMARMPGSYAPPYGDLLIALASPESEDPKGGNSQPQVLGCIALRELHLHESSELGPVGHANDGKATSSNKPNTRYCELKRLYVTPAARGLGVGKALVRAMISLARQIGYEEVRLDTLPEMREAIAMYSGMGFEMIEKYYEKAIDGTVFLALRL